MKSGSRIPRSINPEANKIAEVESIAFIKCGSHRAYDKIKKLVGKDNLKHYWWSMFYNYQVTEIPKSFLQEALKITGVTQSKPTTLHHRSMVK